LKEGQYFTKIIKMGLGCLKKVLQYDQVKRGARGGRERRIKTSKKETIDGGEKRPVQTRSDFNSEE